MLDLSQPWAALGRLTQLEELRLYHGHMQGIKQGPGRQPGGRHQGSSKQVEQEPTGPFTGQKAGVFDLAWLPPSLLTLSAWLPGGSSVQLAGRPLPAHAAGPMPQGGPLAGLHSVAVCGAKGLVMVEASVRGDRARAHRDRAMIVATGTAAVGATPRSDGWHPDGFHEEGEGEEDKLEVEEEEEEGREEGQEEEGREEEQGPAKEGVQEVGQRQNSGSGSGSSGGEGEAWQMIVATGTAAERMALASMPVAALVAPSGGTGGEGSVAFEDGCEMDEEEEGGWLGQQVWLGRVLPGRDPA